MREQPWHLRRLSTEHYLWYRNLLDLHALTREWLNELKLNGNPPRLIERTHPAYPDLASEADLNLQTLEKLLDDTDPNDLLGRLEKAIWTVQSWVLWKTKAQKRPQSELKTILEQASWRAGRDCAHRRWKILHPESDSIHPGDLRSILASFHDSPLSGFPKMEGFLIRRATATEVELQIRNCPDQQEQEGLKKEIAPFLCELQGYWVRGFVYYFNPRVSVDRKNCRENWFLPP